MEHGEAMEQRDADPAVRPSADQSLADLDAEEFPTLSRLPHFWRVADLTDQHFQFQLRLMIEGVRDAVEGAVRPDWRGRRRQGSRASAR